MNRFVIIPGYTLIERNCCLVNLDEALLISKDEACLGPMIVVTFKQKRIGQSRLCFNNSDVRDDYFDLMANALNASREV